MKQHSSKRVGVISVLGMMTYLLSTRISWAGWGENWGTMVWGTGLGTGIPALTTWGLVVLTIAVLTTGVIILWRRKRIVER